MKHKFSFTKFQNITGLFFILFSVFLLIAAMSFFFHWQEDQSILQQNILNRTFEAENILGVLGARISNFFIYKGLGIGGVIFVWIFGDLGFFLFLNKTSFKKLLKRFHKILITTLWFSVCLGFLKGDWQILAGNIGVQMNQFLRFYLGAIGLIFLLLFICLSYLMVLFKIQPQKWMKKIFTKKACDKTKLLNPPLKIPSNLKIKNSQEKKYPKEEMLVDLENLKEEEKTTKNLSDKLVESFGEFDPTLDLKNYKFPTFDFLKNYDEQIAVDSSELEENKDQIVETLKNYKIEIDQIKATVGPTVTLYEIVPERGIRISKIKNLEDDIALSLAALGIRIIAPIPGKGTIGIEVPNKKPTMVSMRSVVASKKFQESKMILPIAFGKTIANETFVVDLAKMPHLLMAGATGQGKSVGLNVILTSILYKKHPAEVKFILVDPKKVELTLFNKIERHYLAKLPDTEEAIITDTSKVVNTMNSLCLEMDTRYELLKKAEVRNIEAYNQKLKERKLNPENGHRFLPYLILVVDEFADLIMTAGKDIETPIARLAQLARAIGIHLIIATQRPSVNVITGSIKANFPSRIAFRVTSKIDSRTILDAPGADQLIGKGDMLYSGGSDVLRLQCAFVDTPEVEKITEFIGSQRAYSEAYLLPEYEESEKENSLNISKEKRDDLFVKAAEMVVSNGQGSTSLLQRKLEVGYNRAGRLMDQLESAKIVGPFQGSKAREVLIPDLVALDDFLANEK